MGLQSTGSSDKPQLPPQGAATDQVNGWRPDLSRERNDWRDAHAKQKEASLTIDKDGVYTVKAGDTLYDIAHRMLKENNEAADVTSINQAVKVIVQQNLESCPALQDNPHLIHAGDKLKIATDASASTVLEIPPLPTEQAAPKDALKVAVQGTVNDLQINQTDAQTPAPPPIADSAPPPEVVASPAVTGQQNVPVDAQPDSAQPQLNNATRVVDSVPPLEVQQPSAPPPQQMQPDSQPLPPAAVYAGADGSYYAPPPPPPSENYDVPNAGAYYAPPSAGDYTDQEANRISRLMYDDPHAAADELRNQIASVDSRTAGVLIAKTKGDESVGGLGDLQIQAEFDQYGRDTGYRNVTMATPDGIEQIAELQSRTPAYNGYQNYQGYPGENALGFVAGVIVGDLLWQQQRGIDFNDDRYRGWCNREQYRENYWNQNNDQFVQNWQNQNYRNQFQGQNWQQTFNHPSVNNTYITNNRYDTTINNRRVDTTNIYTTIDNTKQNVYNPVRQGSQQNHPIGSSGVRPYYPSADTGHGPERLPQNRPAQGVVNPGYATRNLEQSSQQQQEAARERAAQQQQQEATRERAAQQQQQEASRERAAQQQQQEATRERAAQQQQQEATRERAAQQQQQEAARERAAQQQQQEASRERAAQQQQQEATRERAAQQQQQEATRERAAQQQQQEATRERAAQQQQQEATRERAAQQQQQEATRERAAQQQQQQQEAARERAAQKQTAAVQPQQHVLANR